MKRVVFLLNLFLACTFSVQSQTAFWKRNVIDSAFSGADGVRLADVNGDRLPDIATGWEEGGFTKVYLHPGLDLVRQKWPSVIAGKTLDVEDAVLADLDLDGNVDVISSTEGDTKKVFVHWAPSQAKDYLDSSKWESQVLPASEIDIQWMFAYPVQLDGLNGPDLVLGSKGKEAKIGWFQAPINPRNLDQWTWHPISPATWIMSIFMKDMDGDGDLDILTSDRKPGPSNGVRWLENPGNAKKQQEEWPSHFIGCEGLEVKFIDTGDLDGDGLEDVVATESTNQQIVWMKRLDTQGLNWERYTIDIPKLTGRGKAVKIGDINGDGKPDLAHTTEASPEGRKSGVFWLSYRDNPSESQWDWHNISGPEGYKYDRIELVDLDEDGDLDLLTCEENYGSDSKGLGVIWYENPLNP